MNTAYGRPMEDALGEAYRAAQEARFTVQTTRHDGTRESRQTDGGSSFDHAIAAMERAGLGSTVRIRPDWRRE